MTSRIREVFLAKKLSLCPAHGMPESTILTKKNYSQTSLSFFSFLQSGLWKTYIEQSKRQVWHDPFREISVHCCKVVRRYKSNDPQGALRPGIDIFASSDSCINWWACGICASCIWVQYKQMSPSIHTNQDNLYNSDKFWKPLLRLGG